jgi:hypothetical protein
MLLGSASADVGFPPRALVFDADDLTELFPNRHLRRKLGGRLIRDRVVSLHIIPHLQRSKRRRITDRGDIVCGIVEV